MTQETPEAKPLNPSPAEDFKKKASERHEAKAFALPSGLIVMVKRPSIKLLITQGFVPDKIAQRIINSQGQPGKPAKFDKDALSESYELQAIVAAHSVTKPQVLPEGEEPDYSKEQISVKDLEDGDLDAIFVYVTTGGRPDAVETFRGDKTGVST